MGEGRRYMVVSEVVSSGKMKVRFLRSQSKWQEQTRMLLEKSVSGTIMVI